jgi:hypothetical protein
MSDAQEALSPYYIREQRIALSVNADYAMAELTANKPFIIEVDESACAPEGLSGTLELIIAGPSPQSYRVEQLDADEYPSSLPIRLIEGGPHLITLKETAHNKWSGSIHVDAKGSTLTKQRPV